MALAWIASPAASLADWSSPASIHYAAGAEQAAYGFGASVSRRWKLVDPRQGLAFDVGLDAAGEWLTYRTRADAWRALGRWGRVQCQAQLTRSLGEPPNGTATCGANAWRQFGRWTANATRQASPGCEAEIRSLSLAASCSTPAGAWWSVQPMFGTQVQRWAWGGFEQSTAQRMASVSASRSGAFRPDPGGRALGLRRTGRAGGQASGVLSLSAMWTREALNARGLTLALEVSRMVQRGAWGGFKDVRAVFRMRSDFESGIMPELERRSHGRWGSKYVGFASSTHSCSVICNSDISPIGDNK